MNSNGVLPSSEIFLFQFTSLFLCGVTTWQPYISLIIQCFMNVRNTWKLIVILYENSISLDYFFRSTSLLLLSLLMSSQNHCMLPFFIVFFASWAWSTLFNQLHLEGMKTIRLWSLTYPRVWIQNILLHSIYTWAVAVLAINCSLVT